MVAPQAINAIRASNVVVITWSPDHVATYPNKWLRGQCGCAGCVDEMTGRRILDMDSIPEDIGITAMSPVGNYAVQFDWSDGHNTGLYSWERLREICPCPKCRGTE